MRSINIANYTLPEGKAWKYCYSDTEFHDDYGNCYKIVDDDGEMKLADKLAWLKTATNEQLLSQYHFLMGTDQYGRNAGDIKIVKGEILSRMEKA